MKRSLITLGLVWAFALSLLGTTHAQQSAWVVQVGAFQYYENALRQQQYFTSFGAVYAPQMVTQDNLYKLWISTVDLGNARLIADNIKQAGLDAFVRTGDVDQTTAYYQELDARQQQAYQQAYDQNGATLQPTADGTTYVYDAVQGRYLASTAVDNGMGGGGVDLSSYVQYGEEYVAYLQQYYIDNGVN